ncbi:MAG: four helix bundle protein [Deltaproteobacteria bacterium]|nr:four helix bundle protein [Deltaproteobacteria bacterium]
MEHANSFKELVVYQKAQTLAQSIFEITKSFPKEEMYSLTDQIRRSSRSIGAQIAEAWGKRRYEKHFISKLTDADAEQLETQHWIIIVQDCEYLTREQFETLNQNLSEIGRMIYSMINKANQFCSEKTDH